MEKKLIWLDLEMTGLDPNAERIIEIYTCITNEDLTEIIEGPGMVISQSKELIDGMDEWNQEHHSASGLIDEVLAVGDIEFQEKCLNCLVLYFPTI